MMMMMMMMMMIDSCSDPVLADPNLLQMHAGVLLICKGTRSREVYLKQAEDWAVCTLKSGV